MDFDEHSLIIGDEESPEDTDENDTCLSTRIPSSSYIVSLIALFRVHCGGYCFSHCRRSFTKLLQSRLPLNLEQHQLASTPHWNPWS